MSDERQQDGYCALLLRHAGYVMLRRHILPVEGCAAAVYVSHAIFAVYEEMIRYCRCLFRVTLQLLAAAMLLLPA